MLILEKYLFRKILIYSIIAVLFLIIIFTFFKFLEELSEVGSANYDLQQALLHTFYTVPSIISDVFILGIMIGTINSIGSLNSDKELQIFFTGAFSLKRLIEKLLKYALFLSVIFVALTELFAPYSLSISSSIKNTALGNVEVRNESLWFKEGMNFFLLENKKESKDRNILIFSLKNDLTLSKFSFDDNPLFLKEGIFPRNMRTIELDGFRENINLEVYDNKKNDKDIITNNLGIYDLSPNIRTLNLIDLIKILINTFENNTNFNEAYNEIMLRLTKPLTLVGMILISIPFVLSTSRNFSISRNVFVGISVGVMTHLLSRMSSIVVTNYESIYLLSPILPAIILIVFGGVLIKRKRLI